MKIYQVCEVCDTVYNTMDVEGAEGNVELKGTCEECALEINLGPVMGTTSSFWYN